MTISVCPCGQALTGFAGERAKQFRLLFRLDPSIGEEGETQTLRAFKGISGSSSMHHRMIVRLGLMMDLRTSKTYTTHQKAV